MSAKERPELQAYRELEALVRNLGEELAAFRRRAIEAEARLKQTPTAPTRTKGGGERVQALEAENSALKTRIGRSEDRVRQMIERVRFLRQQLQTQPTMTGSSSA